LALASAPDLASSRMQPELQIEAILAFCRQNLHDSELTPQRGTRWHDSRPTNGSYPNGSNKRFGSLFRSQELYDMLTSQMDHQLQFYFLFMSSDLGH
jgi:hypothetical protein